jgi:hypothetical protein
LIFYYDIWVCSFTLVVLGALVKNFVARRIVSELAFMTKVSLRVASRFTSHSITKLDYYIVVVVAELNQ